MSNKYLKKVNTKSKKAYLESIYIVQKSNLLSRILFIQGKTQKRLDAGSRSVTLRSDAS